MADWIKKLDKFLAFNEKNILSHTGTISAALAEEKAHQQFEKYEAAQQKLEATLPTSDFDKAIEELDLKTLAKPKGKKKKQNPDTEKPTDEKN